MSVDFLSVHPSGIGMTIARHDPYTYRGLIRFNMHNRFNYSIHTQDIQLAIASFSTSPLFLSKVIVV